ncbi:PTS sugar transporter subunit IIA [Alkalicoccobacillus gibsonii]|uniref:PTS sugar transporter subunit IIA n=1 Tax=Alkalicoccobacillus gibsonii TaxID=79881 RepID=UPI0019311F47|nr:fructose PTS transporter subunit IIA [Alkalicoccobacillus gibsonii]MBM0065942.1 PTS sugar transporter subunit IIA [Alkalicoccobacillus gibsonii]
MELTTILQSNFIQFDMKAQTKNQVLEQLIEQLAASGMVTSKQGFLEDVLEREKLGPTGIGSGIAIPHGKSIHVNEAAIAIGRMVDVIEWESLDDQPVKTIILFAVPESDHQNTHLKLLAKVASSLANEKTCYIVLYSNDKEEIIEALS